MPYSEMIMHYLTLGFTHVIPLGLDHILFILCLFFLNSRIKSVIIQCSVFTLAHSLSLGLAASGLILPNANYIEPLIAISILFTAIENIIHDKVNPYRLILIFLFGLLHGMGFANVLKEIGIPNNHFFAALFSFNLGVELGQVMVILTAYFLISKWFSNKSYYKERIVYPISSIIACIALYWTIERVLLI
ncbi:HupE/UreJ family protein [Flavobacterium sp. N1994]|uniref:HupE/UreJ family protein n=1 Tax=Flavobacterium sp. N1994 TaxID=2986827 RepID=UPI002223C762|nr:HupE/UreJ family protein [Flavobacterium sp. N1994]